MCTGIRLVAEDGSVVHARTLEFGTDIHSDVILVPRGFARTATAPGSKPGKAWTSKYSSLGANAESLPIIIDGLNDMGLAVGTFYFPASAGYQPYAVDDAANVVAPWEVGSFLLENYASVDEVKDNVANIIVPDVVWPAWGFVPPVHYIVHDVANTWTVSSTSTTTRSE